MPNPANVTTAAQNTPIVDSWVKNGTPTAEPVTTETPVAETPPPATPPVPEAPPAAAAPSDPPVATMAEFIAARRGDAEFQIPKDVLVPLLRNGKTEYRPIEEIQRSGMRQVDYETVIREHKENVQRFLEERRTFDAERAKMQADQEWLESERRRLEGALTNQEDFDAYQRHLENMKDPLYRQAFEDARAKRATDAENATYREEARRDAIERATGLVSSWLDEFSRDARFAGVDVDRIRQRYGQQLASMGDQARLDRRDLERLFDTEAAYLASVRGPIESKVGTLEAELEKLKAALAANSATAHAVERGKAPNTVPAGGPPAPGAREKVKPFGRDQLAQVNSDWAKGKI